MNNRLLRFVSLAPVLTLMAVGCALPGAAQKSSRPPGALPEVVSQAMAGGSAPMAAAPTRPVAPGQYRQPLPGGQSDGPPVSGGVAQVGHFSPAGGAPVGSCASCGGGSHAACPSTPAWGSCGGCGTCRPFGYVLPPQAWNAYGIDPQEFLCDGGDVLPEVRVRRDDSLAGLDLEDTVVHYTTNNGNVYVQPSNRACVYAPRFIAVRKITGALAGGRAVGLSGMDRPVGPVRVEHDLPGLVVTDSTELAHADVARRIDAVRDRNRGVPVEGVLQPELAADVMAALATLKLLDLNIIRDNELALIEQLAQAAVPWTIDESLEVAIADLKPPTLTRDQRVEEITVYEFPDVGRLRIVKLADRADALQGEVVTFMIRVDNAGDSAVNQVVLTDNLTTRLEYVPESQTVEGVEADFSTAVNDGESLRLTWEFKEELKVGQSVTIRFQCKVR